MAGVIIPFPFRKFTGNNREVTVIGATLAECVEDLFDQYPGMNAIQEHPSLLSIFVNGEIIKKKWDKVFIDERDEISLIIPIAGG